jgi:hypothetical protein
MVEEKANIDLLFRNGLKDLEVLPPVGTWNNIYPVIRKKQKPYILLRSAALIAVLLSISFLAYRWSREISTALQNSVVAMEEESFRTGADNFNPVIARQEPVINPQGNTVRVLASVNPETDAATMKEDSQQTGSIQVSTDMRPEFSLFRPANNDLIRKIDYKADNNYSQYNNTTSFIEVISTDLPEARKNKWSLTAIASPSYYMKTGLGSDDLSSQINSSEKSKISYSGGVGFAYRINDKLSIQSGLYYTSIGQEIENIYSFAGFRQFDNTKGDHNFEVLTSGGLIYTENADVFLLDNSGGRVFTRFTNDVFDPAKASLLYLNNSLHQTFSYLEMPLMLRYKLIDKSFNFNLIGGMSYNLLVNNSVYTFVNGSKYQVGETGGLNPFMVSSSLGMGMEYNLTRKISLNLEPMFRYYLNPFSEAPGIKTHPYSFGVFSGLSYRF